ncbi:MAG: hypothetical protein KDB58_04980 [Solirubrobacterales bacterium]|nr:hypothetical protein [Solirubrobacterales bacterium]MCB8969208.1 hypothetical protein [Thermoleophilales bacterium]MCO5328222.1 hypothetical protein [Solirubrobacterales bacterium]
MDVGLEMFIFMGLILKIPVLAAAWLIWHAVKAEPDPAESAEDEGGSRRDHFRRQPRRPRNPRRGPHAPDALPVPCPDDEGKMRVTQPAASARFHDRHA